MRKIKTTTLLISIAFGFAACKKESLNLINHVTGIQPDTIYTNVVKVTIDQTKHGYSISPTFEGLSFEIAVLTQNPEYLNANNSVFIQLIKNLGPGLLRMGGGTSDEINWTGAARTNSTPVNMLTTSDIDRLAVFSKLCGWPVLFGLNLGSYQVNAAADEAAYVSNSLGSSLYAFQFGNEPNYFAANEFRQGEYFINDYMTEWNTYATSVKSVVAKASFAGPDVVQGSDWVSTFADAEHSKVKLIDGHYYIAGPATNSYITYQNLLSPDGVLPSYLQGMQGSSSKYNLPYRITECNNIWGGGKAGVSDIFASALWALDFMWIVAENNGQGINFHDGEGIVYSPLTMSGGTAIVHPEYYAMLAFKYGSNGGTIIPATVDHTGFNCSAYACINTDNSQSITLINKETSTNINFNIQLSSSVTTAQIARLAAQAVTSTTNVTFAGSTLNADGSFTPTTVQQLLVTNSAVNQKKILISVPAFSAAVITLR